MSLPRRLACFLVAGIILAAASAAGAPVSSRALARALHTSRS